MTITYKQIEEVNKDIKTTEIKGKQYAEVNQRIKAFRKLFPNGSIETSIIKNDESSVIMKAIVYNEDRAILGTGLASEKESSSGINRSSHIENCETSAVGRALGMLGLGIDCAVASKDEVLSKEETDALLEKQYQDQSIKYTKLRTELTKEGIDFRSEKWDEIIIKKSKIHSQKLDELTIDELKRLNSTYRGILKAKKEKDDAIEIQKYKEEHGAF